MKLNLKNKFGLSMLSVLMAVPFLSSVSTTNLFRTNAEGTKEYDYSLCKNVVPDGYYNGLSNALTKDAFSDKLCDIISTNTTLYSYDNVGKIILHDSDMDPNNPDNTLCLYTGQSLRGGWNREHVWCKSHGFSDKTSYDPYRDAHHIRVTNSTANSKRNNSDYGEVDHATAYKDMFGNFYTGNTYEPRDEVKGDCARMIFYMAIRYRKTEPYKAKIIEGSSLSYTTGYGEAVFGNLSTLLKWHYQDPVSVDEIYRNNVIYGYQKNRNPFIDHPEYIEYCYDVNYGINISVNKKNMDEMLDLIRAIPNTVTLEDEVTVMNAYRKYDKDLNNTERNELSSSSYSTLMNAVKEIRRLKLQKENDNIAKTTYFETSTYKNADGSTANFSTNKYYSSLTIPYNYGDIYFSDFHWEKACDAYQISLGKNSSNALPSNITFGKNSAGDYLETQYEYEDITSIKFFSPAPKRDLSNFYGYGIYLKTGETYSLLKYEKEWTSNIEVTLEAPATGKVGLVIYGIGTAICLQSMTVIEKDETNTCASYISSLETKANLSFEFDNNSIKNLKLSFGALISYSTIDEISKHHQIKEYGVFVAKSTDVSSSINDVLSTLTSNESDKIKEELITKKISVKSTKEYVRTSDQGRNEDPWGSQIFFSDEIALSLQDKNITYKAAAYILMDNDFVLLKEREESLSSLANKYISRGVDNNLQNCLNQLAN